MADRQKTLKKLEEEASEGQAVSQYELALRYEQGIRCEPDLKRARNLFRQAAEQDHAGASFHLGMMYLTGQGVSKILKLAAHGSRGLPTEVIAMPSIILG